MSGFDEIRSALGQGYSVMKLSSEHREYRSGHGTNRRGSFWAFGRSRQEIEAAKVLRLLRRSVSLSCRALAREIGIDPQLMRAVENSGGALLTPETAKAIGDVLRRHGATQVAVSVLEALSRSRGRNFVRLAAHFDAYAGRCLVSGCSCTNYRPSSSDIESDEFFECATCAHQLEEHEYVGRNRP